MGDTEKLEEPQAEQPKEKVKAEKPPKAEKVKGEKVKAEKPPKAEKLEGAQAEGAAAEGEKPEGEKPKGDKPKGDKPKGDKPKGDKPKGDKGAKGDKAKTDKKAKEPVGKPLRTPESRLRKKFRTDVVASMMRQFSWKNPHQVPHVEKVIVNIGVGDASRDIKLLEAAQRDLTIITGQKPLQSRARKSVAAYKIRTGMPIGAFVTLRGNRMYEFLDRLFSLALPRVRDFQGLNPNSFDGTGNFTFGIREQLVFPEIDYDEIDKVRGMDITIVTTAENDMQALALLRHLGCPFRGTTGIEVTGESEG
jgi:large subunit ribosomal protein L5